MIAKHIESKTLHGLQDDTALLLVTPARIGNTTINADYQIEAIELFRFLDSVFCMETMKALTRILVAQDHVTTVTDNLNRIALIGGNLDSERHTGKTGPNDAALRGLMYTEARLLAVVSLMELGLPRPSLLQDTIL